MKLFICVCVILVAICCSNALPVRQKRQWNWDSGPSRPVTPAIVNPTPAVVNPTPAVVNPTPAVVNPTPAVVNPTPAVVNPAQPAAQQARCINACQVTSQYNPVCGTNRVTYDNSGKLNCAKGCGVNVDVLFNGTCSPLRRR